MAIAQGHDITKNTKARYKASLTVILNNNGKKITVKIANIKTVGVYNLAALLTNVSVLAFLSVAVSTKSNIFETVLFS